MARLLELKPSKTYATKKNAIKAVQDEFGHDNFRFIIANTEDGRFYPICIGQEACTAQAHFYFVTVS